MANLDDLINHELTSKVGKYVGYSIEACGFCGIVYGICTGDNYTTLSGGFLAYFGTFVHRSFRHLQKQGKGSIEGKEIMRR